ncbi:histidine kinase [filamentous cyanobacterium CCP5]|nr:histidine kinase [filamentous cyanobacterium CCP5]
MNVIDAIAEEFDVCGFPHPQEFTELFLKTGRLLVLLDGLDEVPSDNLNAVITDIENLVDRYSDNRFIASCRIAAYNFGGFKRFKDVAMAAFEDKQIERFIKNWFNKPRDVEAETPRRCWEKLKSNEYAAAKELAQTPLLLTLLCVVYDEFQDFPKKRHALYGEALDVLLRKWAAEKRFQDDQIYQKFGADLELELLSEIAYTSFVDNQLFFDRQTLLDQIRDFQTDNENAPDLDPARILREIEVQQGILVERARNTYSFSHLTFQEYLTAKYIVDNQKVEQVIRGHIVDNRWREIFLLIAGLVPGRRGADVFLRLMERQAQAWLTTDKLKALVNWATFATEGSPGDAKPAAKRVAAIALAITRGRARAVVLVISRYRDHALSIALRIFRGIDLDIPLDFALDIVPNLELDMAQTIASEYQSIGIFKEEYINSLIKSLDALELEIPSDTSNKSIFDNLRKIISTLWETLNIDPDNLRLSEEEREDLANYFNTLDLIASCKESAVRVSPQVWEGIESRMVTVPADEH